MNNIEKVQAAIDYIEDHLTEKLDLDVIASAVHYSKYHLHRVFSKTVGLTLHEYRNRRQLTEAAKLLVYRAAWAKDNHLPYSVESAHAKLYAAETAMRVTTECVQLLGGYGYTREYPVERMMRDAKITQIYEGTSEVQRMVISRSLLR